MLGADDQVLVKTRGLDLDLEGLLLTDLLVGLGLSLNLCGRDHGGSFPPAGP
jgi:hypothetical protein